MTKVFFPLFATILIAVPASANSWHCGFFTKYHPQHQIFGVIGDQQYGPAIVKNFTKDPKKLKKFFQHGNCYCVKGTVVNLQQFGNSFLKMNQIAWCPNYDHPADQELQ